MSNLKQSDLKGSTHPLHGDFITYRKYCLNKISLISSISTDMGMIQFHYSDREKSLFDPEKDTAFGAACGAKLDSLVFTSNRSLQKTIKLEYKYAYQRMLLTSIFDSQAGRYNLNYNYCPDVDPFTVDIDHWGYWSGNSSNINLLPNLDYSQIPFWLEGPLTKYRGTNREATGLNYDVFLLNEIQYPTGGYTKYKYEPQDYERYIGQETFAYNLHLYGSISGNQKGKLAGGARLKRIENYSDHSTLTKTVSYQYTDGINSQRSSGILLKRKPAYVYSVRPNDQLNFMPICYKSDGYQTPADYSSSYIEYSSIIEYYANARDSSRNIQINPLDDIRIKYGEISFGNSTNYKLQNHVLEMRGTGSQSHPGKITLQINGSKKSETREYQFNSSTIEYVESYKVILNLLEEFGEGVVNFYMDALIDEFLSIKISMSLMDNSTQGYKEYKFTDFSSNQDSEYRTIISPEGWASSADIPFVSFYGKKVLDHSQERGLLSMINSYNANGNLVQTIERKYERQNYDNYGISVFVHPSPVIPGYDGDEIDILKKLAKNHQVFKIPLYTYLQTENIVTNYSQDKNMGIPFINKETYKYDTNGYLKTKEIKLLGSTNNASSSIGYKYAFEESGEPYLTMKNLNILSPVTQSSTYQGMTTPQLTSVLRNNYELAEGLYGNVEITEKILPVIKSVEYGKNETLLEKRMEYSKFDFYGNPISLMKDSVTHLVYLWGYQGQHPIAYIEGATYDEVLQALNNTPLESLSFEAEPNLDILKNLRKKLPLAHIYTFTYTPFIGRSSMTDPKGITTYYEYDNKNRLKEIYTINLSGQKEIHEHYQYSFK